MKKATKIIVILLAIILAAILLIPSVGGYDDGGTMVYEAPLYTVYVWNTIHEWGKEGQMNKYEVGYTVEILGITVYDHRYIEE
ncbi:MAG: hypothetical protein IJN34_02985 [Clostridia bacterium]|nr:hypothetical protein [Clostridia bacterium]